MSINNILQRDLEGNIALYYLITVTLSFISLMVFL